MPIAFSGSRCVLYLKTNLGLGIVVGGAVAHTKGILGALIKAGYSIDMVSSDTTRILPNDPALNLCHIQQPQAYVLPKEMNHYLHNDHVIKGALPLFNHPHGFIYQRMSAGNISGVVLSRGHNIPLILEYNGSEVWLAKNWGSSYAFPRMADISEEVCLKHATLIVTVSDVLRDELIERGVEPDRIVSQPNGVNPEDFDPKKFSKEQCLTAREKLAIPEESIVVTFAGTFGHWHGAEVLAETVTLLARNEMPWLEEKNIHFAFIGDGAKRSNVEAILSTSNAAGYYTMTGLVPADEIPLLLSASDILISPHVANADGTAFFGSPIKLFEYLASGRPVIASELNQITEVMGRSPHISTLIKSNNSVLPAQDQCGVMVTPENAEDLAMAIHFLIDNPKWMEGAGRNARIRAISKYTWDHTLSTILERIES